MLETYCSPNHSRMSSTETDELLDDDRYQDQVALDAHMQATRFKETMGKLTSMVDLNVYASQPVSGFGDTSLHMPKDVNRGHW